VEILELELVRDFCFIYLFNVTYRHHALTMVPRLQSSCYRHRGPVDGETFTKIVACKLRSLCQCKAASRILYTVMLIAVSQIVSVFGRFLSHL